MKKYRLFKKEFITVLLLILFKIVSGQNSEISDAVKEGYLLFRLESASWITSDTLGIKYPLYKSKGGGYLSYEVSDTEKTIIWDKDDHNKILVTINYTNNFHDKTVQLKERKTNKIEDYLVKIRIDALERLNGGDFFKHYNKTSFNIIPVLHKDKGIIYIITATADKGVVIFGNDYFLEYNLKGKFENADAYHKTLIPTQTSDLLKNRIQILEMNHTHISKYKIAPTEICTLLLYRQYIKWKTFKIIGENYTIKWDVQKGEIVN